MICCVFSFCMIKGSSLFKRPKAIFFVVHITSWTKRLHLFTCLNRISVRNMAEFMTCLVLGDSA